MKGTKAAVVVAVLAMGVLVAPAAIADDEWKFGIGTGFFGLNLDGDVGLTTALGPVSLDLDLNTSDIQDLLDTAFGLGGYATKDKWTLTYQLAYLKLEDSISGVGPMGNPVAAKASFTAQGGEFAAAYRFAMTGKHAWGVLGGLRHTRHEFDSDLRIDDDPPNPPTALTRNIDENWTDILVGLTHGTKLSDKWGWTNRLDAGFGGSEGTYHFKTNFAWQFASSWSLGLYGQATAVEYENDSVGDPNHYLYDIDEFGLGFTILYSF